ncbi:MAG: FG-GAP-like repeat-containing protein [Salibacteraceae bacterium]
MAIADIDGDGDLDLYIAGFSGFNVKSGNLYTNDGTGTFTEVTGTGIDVLGSAAAFADIDGDNDQDLLITGTTGTTLNNVSTKLYRNDGEGCFSSDTNSNLIGSSSGAIAFMDMDGDADLDLFIVGYASGAIPTSTLYTNDGTGLFTQVAGTPFTGVAIGDIAIDDADDDGDIDILITGNAFPTAVTELYLNDGNGGFSLLSGTPFSGAVVSSVALRDVDGDFDKDVIVSGLLPGAGPGGFLTKVYLKDGVGSNVNVKETLEKEAGHLSIFPNPSNRGRITIGWSGSEEKVNGFTIFDVSGRTLIASQTPRILQGNRITIDTCSLKQGTYLIEVYHDGTVSYGRFVVANSN